MTYEPMARASDVNIWTITVKFVSWAVLHYMSQYYFCWDSVGMDPNCRSGDIFMLSGNFYTHAVSNTRNYKFDETTRRE